MMRHVPISFDSAAAMCRRKGSEELLHTVPESRQAAEFYENFDYEEGLVAHLLFSLSFSRKGQQLLGQIGELPSLMQGDHAFAPIHLNQTCDGSPLPVLPEPPRTFRKIPEFAEATTFRSLALWLHALLKGNNWRESRLLQPPPERTSDSISILTFNVWGLPNFTGEASAERRRLRRIAESLENSPYDVIALQEMWQPETGIICAASGYEFQAFGTLATQGVIGGSGLVTLSRYPIVTQEFLPFSTTAGLERFVKKGALFTRICKGSGIYADIYNLHAISEPEKLNKFCISRDATEAVREKQLRELKGWVLSRSKPSIPVYLAGDFNVSDSSLTHGMMQELFGSDLFRRRLPLGASSCNRLGFTFDPEKNPLARSPHMRPERLDYLFCNQGLPEHFALKAQREFVEDPLSDHYAVGIQVIGCHS